MDLGRIKDIIKRQDGLSDTLGMEFIPTPEPDTCMIRMKVDDSNRQVFGFLNGGATLALAENLASAGSMALCPNKICVGINASGNHVRPVMEDDTVTAHGRLQHKDDTLYQWHIEIKDRNDELISTVRMTNFAMHRPKK